MIPIILKKGRRTPTVPEADVVARLQIEVFQTSSHI